MTHRDIIVVAASAGGLQPLRAVVAGLPAGFAAALFIVQHVGRQRSLLPALLASAGPLPALPAQDGMRVEPGRILVAPPDAHLLLERERVRLGHGPIENCTRPAADPLFRSAAEAYGERVVGVVLSGMLADGTAGLAAVKRRGGIAVVQDPADAGSPGMPRSALAHVAVDHCLPVAGIPGLLVRLAAGGAWDGAAPTCPACGGALAGQREGGPGVGQARAARLGEALELALRTLDERTSQAGRMADSMRRNGMATAATRWGDAQAQAEERAGSLRRFLEQDWARPVTDDGDP